jgi:hypothetical protein
MLFGRLIGWVFVLAGMIVVIRDAVLWHETGTFRLSSGGEIWFQAHRDSLNLLQAVVQRYLTPVIWDPGIQTVLLWPAMATLVGIGLFLLLLFRRR